MAKVKSKRCSDKIRYRMAVCPCTWKAKIIFVCKTSMTYSSTVNSGTFVVREPTPDKLCYRKRLAMVAEVIRRWDSRTSARTVITPINNWSNFPLKNVEVIFTAHRTHHGGTRSRTGRIESMDGGKAIRESRDGCSFMLAHFFTGAGWADKICCRWAKRKSLRSRQHSFEFPCPWQHENCTCLAAGNAGALPAETTCYYVGSLLKLFMMLIRE